MGYTNIRGYIEGFPNWKAKGMPVAVSPKHILAEMEKEMPFVLVDVRPKSVAEKEHIPSAVNIPLKDLANAKDLFPEHKKAPIYVYAESDEEAIKATSTIRSWGYVNVAYIPGGIEAWKKAGGKTEAQKLATKIVYVPKPRPGTFPVDEFKKIVEAETLPDKYVILDVREPDELQSGHFKKALHIPLSELEAKVKELPKDKIYLVHCATGVRAEMAYNILKKAGLNAYYIYANIEFDGEKYKIEPRD